MSKTDNKTPFRDYELTELHNIIKKAHLIEKKYNSNALRSLILERLFHKVVINVNSYIHLESLETEELDISTLASISRNIMDAVNNYFYFAERGLEYEEIEIRYELFLHHYSRAEKRIKNNLEIYDNKDSFIYQITDNDEFFNEFLNTDSYKKLTTQQQSAFKRDRLSKLPYYNKKEILERKTESALFNLFSQNTHALGLGFNNTSAYTSLAITGTPFFDPIKLLFLSIEVILIYSSKCLLDYFARTRSLSKIITEKDRKNLKRISKSINLIKWLDEERKISENYDPWVKRHSFIEKDK